MNQKGYRTTPLLILFSTGRMLNVLYILEAFRHNFITGCLRLSLQCARWDKCNFMYRHLPDLDGDISSSRLRHWLFRRMFALFCFYESLIKESSHENSWFSHDVTKMQNDKTINPTEILLLWCIRAAEN